ncbi:MAG TPA: response regulator transcription factor [Acidimicrobiia bacterium]
MEGAGGPSVLVVEDHGLVAGLLVDGLRAAGFDAVAVFGNSLESVRAAMYDVRPEICLLDFDLGTLGSALPLITTGVEVGARVVMLSAHEDDRTVAECIEAGAVGFLSKDIPVPQLVGALRSLDKVRSLVSEPERFELLAMLRQSRSAETARLSPFQRLTKRESEVLAAICEGGSAAEIAEAWVVSVATVRTHIRAILTKLGVKSQVEAIAMARKAGWVAAPIGSSGIINYDDDGPG